MLPLNVRAKIILSDEAAWDQLAQLGERRAMLETQRPSLRARLMRASGGALIAAGSALQRLGGVPALEFERPRAGEMAR